MGRHNLGLCSNTVVIRRQVLPATTEPEFPPGPFTIGVGGIIIDDDKVLLVKLTYGHMGWILPGGYVKSTETIGQAVKREVREETGLQVEPLKLVSVRSRADGGQCDVYLAFLAKVLGGELKPDNAEISDLRYFSLDEMEGRSDVPKLNTWIVRCALKRDASGFSLSSEKPNTSQLYELWL